MKTTESVEQFKFWLVRENNSCAGGPFKTREDALRAMQKTPDATHIISEMLDTEGELPFLSFSAIWSDRLKAAIQERAPREGYPIECHEGGSEFMFIRAAIMEGIDSHLEAVRFSEFRGEHGRRGFRFERETLHVLIRRLMEVEDTDPEGSGDTPASLASSICQTLNIELI